MDNKFNFFIPVDIEKAKDSKGGQVLKVKGICSDDQRDSDEEFLDPSGYDLQYFLENGFINYNHRAKDDPSSIIGEPTFAKIVGNGKQMYMEGILYPDNKKARDVYELAQTLSKNKSSRKLGWSIEGQVIERDILNSKIIKKARITGVAITPCPKNFNTFVDIVKGQYVEEFLPEDEEEIGKKSEEENEEKEKAMMANPSLTHEDVEGKPKYLTKAQVYAEINKAFGPIDISKSKEIFNFVSEYSKSLNKEMGEITKDRISKAFSILQNVEVLEKIEKGMSPQQIEEEQKRKPPDPGGKKIADTPSPDEKDAKQAPEPEPTSDENTSEEGEENGEENDDEQIAKSKSKKESIKKGMDDDEDEDDEDVIDSVSKAMCSKNKEITKSQLIEKLIKKGFSLEASQNSANKVLAEVAKQKNGTPEPSKINLPSDSLEKAQEYFSEMFDSYLETSVERSNTKTKEFIKGLETQLNKKFSTMGEVFEDFNDKVLDMEKSFEEIGELSNKIDNLAKSYDSAMETLRKQDDLIKSQQETISKLNKEVEEINKYPVGQRKSVVNAIERFDKSHDSNLVKMNLSIPEQKKHVCKILMDEFSKSQGTDINIEKSIKGFELGVNPKNPSVERLLAERYNIEVL